LAEDLVECQRRVPEDDHLPADAVVQKPAGLRRQVEGDEPAGRPFFGVALESPRKERRTETLGRAGLDGEPRLRRTREAVPAEPPPETRDVVTNAARAEPALERLLQHDVVVHLSADTRRSPSRAVQSLGDERSELVLVLEVEVC
jgi:hypothetical protein